MLRTVDCPEYVLLDLTQYTKLTAIQLIQRLEAVVFNQGDMLRNVYEINDIIAFFRFDRDRSQFDDCQNDLRYPMWHKFLESETNLSTLARQVLKIAETSDVSPWSLIESIRNLVEMVSMRTPRSASSFLKMYLKERTLFPEAIRGKCDVLVMAGARRIPVRAATLASVIGATSTEEQTEIFCYWYKKILAGYMSIDDVRIMAGQILTAKDLLLEHRRTMDGDPRIDESVVYEKYGSVLTAQDILGMVEIAIYAEKIRLDIDVQVMEYFLNNLPKSEVIRRFKILGEWMDGVNVWTNYDGVIITDLIAKHLSQPGDFNHLLSELDTFRENTKSGRFDINNLLQRDLEFKHMVSYRTNLHQEPWPYGLYKDFVELKDIGPQRDCKVSLSREHCLNAKRAAYEAACFLVFLKEFRNRTSRDIVVVGNERYGSQWVVEPLEEYLKEDFKVRYEYVHSGASMRLTVPSAFKRDLIVEMSERMPHVVVVDGANLPKSNPYKKGSTETLKSVMRCSRAHRGFANWFAVFNDVRSKGNVSIYENESSLPIEDFTYLKKWHEFMTMRTLLEEIVVPGEIYKVTTWAPKLEDMVLLGDILMDRPNENWTGDRPLVVLANTNIYESSGDKLPSYLHGSDTYYFDGPERFVEEQIICGLGSHGFETRLKGPTTEMFVAAVQKFIRDEVKILLENKLINRI